MADETDVQTEAQAVAGDIAAAQAAQIIETQTPLADISDDPAQQASPIAIDQPTSAPVLDTESPLFVRFRRLWKGGERRAAVEWAKVMNVAEDEWAALMGEFPELLDVINS